MPEQDLPPDVLALLDVRKRSTDWKESYEVQFDLIRRLMSEKIPDRKRILVELSLLVLMGIKCFTLRDTDEILFYNKMKGIWDYGAENIIRQIVHKVDDELTSYQINEVIDKVRRSTYGSRNLFINNPHLALQNCVINLETFEIEPHSPEHYLTNKLDIEYDPDAVPHRIEQFFSEILPSKDIPKVQEMIAYCLLPDYRFQKAFICVGEGSNGKSTLLSLIGNFLGGDNISNVLMQDFDKKTFAASKLYGKMANIAADLPEREMKETGMFKMLTGGDRITAERKYKEPFEFVNKAKLIFSANKPPIIYDDVDAIWRRLCLIHFPYQFVGSKANPKILDQLTTPKELSGLLNACLIALFRLKERGQFEIDEDIQKLREEYLMVSNPMQCFIERVLEDNFDGYELKSNVDQAYIKYVKIILKKIPKPVGTLTKALPRLKEHVIMRQPRIDNKKVRVWAGIKIRDDYRWLLDGTGGTTGTTFPSMLARKQEINKYIGPDIVPPVPDVPKKGGDIHPAPKLWKEDILEVLREFQEDGLTQEEIIEYIEKERKLGKGFHNLIIKAINKLLEEGLIYEPRHGVFRRVGVE